jgi:hypothetical protein
MTKRVVYDILPSRRGWRVKRQGAQRAYRVLRTKARAVTVATLIAKRHQPSQVVVRKLNGKIETEWTYLADPVRHVG